MVNVDIPVHAVLAGELGKGFMLPWVMRLSCAVGRVGVTAVTCRCKGGQDTKKSSHVFVGAARGCNHGFRSF